MGGLLRRADRQVTDCVGQFIGHHQRFVDHIGQKRRQLRRHMRQNHAQPLFADARQHIIHQCGSQLLFGFPSFSVQIQGFRGIQRIIPIHHGYRISIRKTQPIEIASRDLGRRRVKRFPQLGKPARAFGAGGEFGYRLQHRNFRFQRHQVFGIGLPLIHIVLRHAAHGRVLSGVRISLIHQVHHSLCQICGPTRRQERLVR